VCSDLFNLRLTNTLMATDAELHTILIESLNDFYDPETGRPLAQTGQVSDWRIAGGHVQCRLALTSHSQPIAEEVAENLRGHFMARCPSIQQIEVKLDHLKRPPVAIGQIGLRAKSVIAVGAGKGGVGKSTLAASLAISLEKLGSKVGLMDADVYGPSIPHLLGLSGRPGIEDGKIQPIMSETMPVMSMGFLVERNQAVVWRGPMLHGSIQQFLRDTAWGELDYLIIDMPPGTGDVALTLSQMLPLAGAVIVCTPQEVALLDASKAIAMFEKTKVPILGIVENMSGFLCPDNGKTYDIFGRGGARKMAEELGTPFLGDVPITIPVRSESDEGRLRSALQDPSAALPMEKIARSLVRELSHRARASGGAAAPLPVLG
jgi:ATP-binding protein involved in chromosome partitioning